MGEAFNSICGGSQRTASMPSTQTWAAQPSRGLQLVMLSSCLFSVSTTFYYVSHNTHLNWSSVQPLPKSTIVSTSPTYTISKCGSSFLAEWQKWPQSGDSKYPRRVHATAWIMSKSECSWSRINNSFMVCLEQNSISDMADLVPPNPYIWSTLRGENCILRPKTVPARKFTANVPGYTCVNLEFTVPQNVGCYTDLHVHIHRIESIGEADVHQVLSGSDVCGASFAATVSPVLRRMQAAATLHLSEHLSESSSQLGTAVSTGDVDTATVFWIREKAMTCSALFGRADGWHFVTQGQRYNPNSSSWVSRWFSLENNCTTAKARMDAVMQRMLQEDEAPENPPVLWIMGDSHGREVYTALQLALRPSEDKIMAQMLNLNRPRNRHQNHKLSASKMQFIFCGFGDTGCRNNFMQVQTRAKHCPQSMLISIGLWSVFRVPIEKYLSEVVQTIRYVKSLCPNTWLLWMGMPSTNARIYCRFRDRVKHWNERVISSLRQFSVQLLPWFDMTDMRPEKGDYTHYGAWAVGFDNNKHPEGVVGSRSLPTALSYAVLSWVGTRLHLNV